MKKAIFVVLAVALLAVSSVSFAGEQEDKFTAVKNRLAIKLAGKVSKAEIEKIFSDPRVILRPELLQRIGKKGKKFSYFSPEFGLFTPGSILRGREFLREKEKFLEKNEKGFGVGKEGIAAIFRIETNFGQNLGSHLIFNNLLTFAVIKNRRSDWAENELSSLFLLGARNHLDILNIQGSWAGAFGLCQFMPSSFLVFAKDGNGDGNANLFVLEDAMASAANYLKRHGWENGDPKKMARAVFAYNHSDEYARAVLAYAKAIRQ